LLPLSFAKKMIDRLVGGSEGEAAAALVAETEMPSIPAITQSAPPAQPVHQEPVQSHVPPVAPPPVQQPPQVQQQPPGGYAPPPAYPGQPMYPDPYAQYA
ncbi:flagellar motor switch phosphatase FliY, partial [Mesorhizobium sp. M00.F.Ca.ET.186.01.1.1]